MFPKAFIGFNPMKSLACFFAITVFAFGIGCITPKGSSRNNDVSLPRIITLEGKNFNKKDSSGEIVTAGDDGWENAPYYFEKEKKPFTGSLTIPFLNNGTNNVQAVISFAEGKQHGESTVWHKNGQKNAKENFDAGKLINGSYWQDDGKQNPAGNKDSSLSVSTKLLAKLGAQALATRGGFGLPPEKDPVNIRFDNWLRFQANADQKKRYQELTNIFCPIFLKQGVGINAAIKMTYNYIRSPQHRHRFFHYVQTGIDPQGAGPGIGPANGAKQPLQRNGLVASGSGFFITNDGYLITNYHVVDGGKFWTVRGMLATRGRELEAKVVAWDKNVDLALLKVNGQGFHGLPIISSKNVKLGQNIFTIGYPRPDLQGIQPKLNKGNVAGLAGVQDNPNLFTVAVPTQPGNSGGPHLSSFGNVIGVHVSSLNPDIVFGKKPELVNYAIKSDVLLDFLRRTGRRLNLSRPFLSPPNDMINLTRRGCVIVLVY